MARKPETLWNHVEKIEKRRDAKLAREINVSLPHELTAEERLALIRGFVMEEFVARVKPNGCEFSSSSSRPPWCSPQSIRIRLLAHSIR